MELLRHALAAILALTVGNAAAEVAEVDDAGLEKLIAQGVPVIDIRTPGEWRATGIVEGSHLLTFFDERGGYDARAWLERLGGIARPDERLVLICATGGRTQVVSQFLDTRLGYSRVINVTRGIDQWIRRGHPTVPPP